MKKWKTWQIFLFVIFCILINLVGERVASHYNLMIWLDSFGTVLLSYIAGPVSGAMAGVTGNLIMSMISHSTYAYAITSVYIAVVVGIAGRKKALNTWLGTMTVSAFTALGAVVVSVPLDLIFNGGSTGNMWGNGVVSFLEEQGWPYIICLVVGAFYVEFLDKFLLLMTLALFFRLLRRIRKKGRKEKVVPRQEDMGRVFKAFPLFILAGLSLCNGDAAAAAQTGETNAGDYINYVQTVFNSNNGLPCGEANDIVETNDGILWVGTYAGLYRYNGREFRWMDDYDSVRNVNCLYVDQEGRLWIGTNDNGLSIYINEKIANVIDEANGLPSDSVRTIVQGSDGYYYVGTASSMQVLTLNNGLKKVGTLQEISTAVKSCSDEKGHAACVTSDGRLFLLEEGQILSSLQLSGDDIFSCCCFQPDGILMAGTSGNRIYTYDVSGGSFAEKKVYECDPLTSIKDLYFLESKELFVTSDTGIGYFDTEMHFNVINVNEFNNSIDNVVSDYQGNLWFTSSRLGLLRLAQSSFRDVYSTAGMETQVVNTVAKWQGNYYFGTDKGLDMVDNTCSSQLEDELTREMEGIRIRCLRTDSKDSLWICTHGKGLLEVEKDGTRHLYDKDNSDIGNRVRVGIELKDGSFLVAGDEGMAYIENHEITDSIRYSDVNIHTMVLTLTEMADGRILAGTNGDGLAIIDERKVIDTLNREEDGLSSDVILRTVEDTKSGGAFLVTSNGLCFLEENGSIRILKEFPYFNNYDIWAKDDDTLFVLSSAGIYVVSRDELVADKKDMSFELLDSRRGLNNALTANSWNYSDEEGVLFLSTDKGVCIIDSNRYALSTRSYRISLASIRMDNVNSGLKRNNTIRVARGVRRLELFPEIINFSIQDPNAGYYLEGVDEEWIIMPQRSLSSIVYTNLPGGTFTLHLGVFDNDRETILEERTFLVVKEKEIYDEEWFIFYIMTVAMLFVAWIPWFFMQRALERARLRIKMGNETIIAIANTVDAKDSSTSMHSYRVSVYAVQIGRRMGFKKKECENLRQAARMHDIGKIGIPDRVLNKPGRLTDEEYALMKSHVTRGSEILQGFTLIDHVAEGARYHHERYDGKGYPDGLKGEEIPLYGRIIGVADAFDAMTANRVYRKQMDLDYVLGEMRRGRGTQFDPQCVDILLGLIEDGTIDVNAMYSSMPTKDEEDKK